MNHINCSLNRRTQKGKVGSWDWATGCCLEGRPRQSRDEEEGLGSSGSELGVPRVGGEFEVYRRWALPIS